ncbi:hypothetical protein EBZ38_13290 [bacterium]|nr:hypothetical protein [bacterium]
MVRIRYIKNNDGLLTSKEPMMAGSVIVGVSISPESFRWVVSSRESGDTLAEGNEVSLVMAKIKAKSKLRSLGVSFDDEVRVKNNSLSHLEVGV